MRTGVDMVDIARFHRVGDSEHDRLFARLFRPDEAVFLKTPREMAEAFALKEAVSKALGTGIAFGVSWHDIQVVRWNRRPQGGAPRSRLERPAVAPCTCPQTARTPWRWPSPCWRPSGNRRAWYDPLVTPQEMADLDRAAIGQEPRGRPQGHGRSGRVGLRGQCSAGKSCRC
jgi:holo-[acyl-carrier-protein] synthase